MAIWNQLALSISNSCDHVLDRGGGGGSAILGDSITSLRELTGCAIAPPSLVQGDAEAEDGREGLRERLLSHANRVCIKMEMASPSEPHTRNGNCQ